MKSITPLWLRFTALPTRTRAVVLTAVVVLVTTTIIAALHVLGA